ncbi:MAG: hypothetical protein EOR00_30995 [Mesorhizobium sp.]|uniref:hypothetical protein n=1 Tax=Mesorhizobium sp. TaxID=1871066 RepID=UPI000FE5E453|nr:hypothetical protein [Mesorhizobium sp.]RWP10341.1 MAG: hypothetical protein EOR00_30995 [Mesorhizobium sp.]
MTKIEFDIALGELTSLHKQFFAEDVDFGDQSSYTSKPYRPAPNEPEGLDEEMRHEYRRAYARNQALKTEEPAARKRALAERRECDHKLGLIDV